MPAETNDFGLTFTACCRKGVWARKNTPRKLPFSQQAPMRTSHQGLFVKALSEFLPRNLHRKELRE